eukprot:4667833-Pyramimonas_sp.AAC.1
MWAHKPRFLHQHVKDPGPLEILEVECALPQGATSDPQLIMAQKVGRWAPIWTDNNASHDAILDTKELLITQSTIEALPPLTIDDLEP